MSSSLAKDKKANSECIRVAIRCRPMSSKEKEEGRMNAVTMDSAKGEVVVAKPDGDEAPKIFTFDSVYDQKSVQEQIFKETAFPILQNVLEGYNGTIFAYGQTGTGKTHTMEGVDDPPEERGIMSRVFESVFQSIECGGNKEFLIRASYLEIYNEDIRDLLSKNPQNKLELKDKPDVGVYVKGLESFIVKSVKEIREAQIIGRGNRVVGETAMNKKSSRSHSIFMITIETSEPGPDGKPRFRVGKLNMVDLAGSERQSKTEATGQRFIEATKINLSLSSLCHVISSLTEAKATYIPYRDSKLTRLLQDSLGGNTKTVMVANIGPADYNYDETINTLRYASRAKHITNKPHINEDPKDAMLRKFQEEIQFLKSQLSAAANGEGVEGGDFGGKKGVIQVEKIIQMEDKEKMKEFEEKLAKEREIIRQKAQKEREKIEQQKNLAEDEKKRLLDALKKKEEDQEKGKKKQHDLLKKIKRYEEKLVHGSKVMQEAVQKELELNKAAAELEEKRIQKLRLMQNLQEKEEEGLVIETKYTNVKEALDDKNKKLKKLWNKYQAAQGEVRDLQDEFHREREDMIDTIRELTIQIKLKGLIIENFIPNEDAHKVESRAKWSDEVNDWVLPPPQVMTLFKKSARPTSAVGLKRPMSEYTRMAKGLGHANPRFKFENILTMDLDMPERTTEDYNGEPSARVQNAISSILQEQDDDIMPVLPFEVQQMMEEAGQDGVKARPKTGKRPGTAKKKKVVA